MLKNLSATKPTSTPSINAECGYCHTGLAVRGDGTYPYLTRNGKAPLVFCSHEHRVAWANGHCEYCDASGFNTTLPIELIVDDKKLRFCCLQHSADYSAVHRRGQVVES